MVIATTKADTLIRKALGRGQASIVSIDTMLDQLSLDPTITNPVKDAFIITNEDISAKRLATKFEQALTTKHPAAKIIFVNKSMKPIYPNGFPGIDAICQKPSPSDLANTISAIISSSTISEVVQPTAPVDSYIPEYHPEVPVEEPVEEVVEEVVNETLELPTEEPEIKIVDDMVPDVKPDTYVDRLSSTRSVVEVKSLMSEISAQALVKEIIETSSTYAGIEEKIKSLNEIMFNIMNNHSIPLEERLTKIRALLHDKTFYHAKGNTVVEGEIIKFFDTVCDQVSKLVNSRLSDIDLTIKNAFNNEVLDSGNTRLAGLNEERANIVIELRKLEIDILNIYKSVDHVAMDLSTSMLEEVGRPTDNDIINMHLKARGATIVSDETLNVVRVIMNYTKGELPDTFDELRNKVLTMLQLFSKLFDVDQEMIAAQQAWTKVLESNNIEDAVTVNSLLKQSMRVFIGKENVGRTIIPYLMSYYTSKQNADVLCIDLTGQGKYEDYDIRTLSLDAYMSTMVERPFLVVSGELENTIANAQRIVSTLLKAADYYRVINVILRDDQKELLCTIAQDTRCVNYITDTSSGSLRVTKDLIDISNEFDNLGRRVIVNKCDVSAAPIIKKLGLDNRDDFQICVIPTESSIVDASLNGYCPAGLSSVDLLLEEVLRYAQPKR